MWGSEYDKKRDLSPAQSDAALEKATGFARKETQMNAVEEVPTSKTRRWWLRLVWACTWWIPQFLAHLYWKNEATRYPTRLEREGDHLPDHLPPLRHGHFLHRYLWPFALSQF